MAMNLRQIEAFRAVMHLGTTIQAAAFLRTSQPAVSRLIRQLEDATRLRLFKREQSRLRPTPEATSLFREVERAFVGLDALRRVADNLRDFKAGHLRIVSLPALGLGFVPRALQRFLQRHPQVTVSLQVHSSVGAREWVATGQVDLGLAADEVDTAGIDAELFTAAPGVCVLPARHPLARREAIAARDLRDQPFLSLAPEDAARLRIEAALRKAGVTVRPVVDTQYAATICNLARSGIGVGIVNPFSAADMIDIADLAVRPFRPAILFRTFLMRPPHRPPTMLADAFVATLAEVRDEELARLRARLHDGPGRRRAR
jgi:DNA-binding transcriptional LysR family regulator